MKIDIWFDDGRCSRCYAPSFDRNLVIAKEDEQVWAEYLTKKIGELLSPDAVDTPEFKAAEFKVRKDRERALRFELRREKEREDYHRRKVMARPKITFIPKGLTVDYEKEYAVFFDQEVIYCPIDSDDFLYQVRLMNRWQDKSVPQIIDMGRPDAAYAIAIELCRHIPLFLNRDDLQGMRLLLSSPCFRMLTIGLLRSSSITSLPRCFPRSILCTSWALLTISGCDTRTLVPSCSPLSTASKRSSSVWSSWTCFARPTLSTSGT